MIKLRKKEKLDTKEKLKIFGPAMVIAIFGFMVAYQFVTPAPPRNISIATGFPKGADVGKFPKQRKYCRRGHCRHPWSPSADGDKNP
jgi:hypothetical protein